MASSSTPWEKQTQPENAFEELAPYSASTSTEPWEIYINHGGPDVKHTLATAIYRTLHSMGFRVFLDADALEAGDSIPAEIQQAIISAALHIAIFSPNYAQSPWCLAELSLMLKSGAIIMPIFYHVDPSDLRYIDQGKGIYASAFSEHEKKGRYKSEKLDEWKRALRDSSFLSGYLVNNNEDEATVLKNIVNDALKSLKKKGLLTVAEYPVGLDELVQGFESVASDEKVKITGIVGMGGSGKTTLAKEIFNRNISSFERCSFVFDVRDAASRNALPDKQKQLLVDLGVNHLPFDTVEEGKAVIVYHLSSLRMLVVLDGVDHIDQLNALLPNKDKLGSQSMVIVTTRELGVLISWGLSLSCIYRMPGLNWLHAQQLFCWHAFLQPSPPAEFKTLVEEFLKACNGLPLSLKVLGAHLYGRKSKDYWTSQLHKILRILPGEIQQRLKVSYDALDEEERQMFLDVACFFIGEKKSTAIAVWDGSGWSGMHGLETLVNRCLVELVDAPNYDGKTLIRMHDHLRDMGREIASRHSPYHLCCPQQIDNMKKHSMKRNYIGGTKAVSTGIKKWKSYGERKLIQGILLSDYFAAFKEYLHQSMGGSNRRLQPLRLSSEFHSPEGNEFTEGLASLSEDLVWLCWENFLGSNITPWVLSRKLRVLELQVCNGLEELRENIVAPPVQLRKIIISGVTFLKIPRSIDHFQHLKKLDFSFDGSHLPAELCGLRWLEHLALSSTFLSALPAGFGNLTSLRYLSLGYCRQLKMLPDSFQQLIHLEWLNLAGCKMLSSLPAGLGNLTNLQCLNLRHCRQLRMLPDSFRQLSHLETLNSSGYKMRPSLPSVLGNLMKLERLDLQKCWQSSMLPDSFQQSIGLEKVIAGNFKSLEFTNLGLSTSPAHIKQGLQVSYDALGEEETEMFLDTACFLIGEKKTRAIALWDGSGWSGLRGLETLENKCLVELVDDPDYHGEKIIKMQDHIRDMGREIASSHSPYRVWSPEQIVNMKKHSMERELIRGIPSAVAFVAFKGYMRQSMGESSTRSQHLKFPTGLQMLSVEGNEFTEELASLSEDLVWLRWEGFPRRNLPPWLPLRNLSVLELHGANEMEELWEDKEHAPLQLRELIITGTWSASFERFPSSISNLNHLIKIALLGDVGKEFGIKVLPEEFCDLQSLEHLELRHCTFLSSLPARFGDLRSLRYLDLYCCKELRILPNSFKQLRQLEYLDLSGCKKLALQIDILENITELKNVNLSGCHKLRQLPHQITDQVCLRKLRLEDTRLEDLPTNIGQLRKLELLTTGSPFLRCLPVSLGDLSSLKSLSIIDCIDLESLPGNLGQLTLLEHLCIESSELRSLPEGFKELANLKTLKISGCPLSELDFGSGSSSALSNLRVIEITETCVARISITEDCCPSLETLHISRNDYLEEIEITPMTGQDNFQDVKIISLQNMEAN